MQVTRSESRRSEVDPSSELSSDIIQYEGDEVGTITPDIARTASEEGYFPNDLERRLTNQIVGGDDIAKYALKESDSSDPSDPSDPQAEKTFLQRSPTRRSSVSERIMQKFGIFDHEIKGERTNTLWLFVKVWAMMYCFMLSVFSIYWGSFYDRTARYKNLKMLIVNDDFQEVNGVSPYFSESLVAIASDPTMTKQGTWIPMNSTDLEGQALSHNNTVEQEIERLIHRQRYWSAIYIRLNASYEYYQAFQNANESFNPDQKYVTLYYETGRDMMAINSYILPFLKDYQRIWLSSLTSSLYPKLLSTLSDDQKTNLILNSPGLLTRLPNWEVIDMRPSTSPVIAAPYQVGSIYLIIITFFQFNFFAAVHARVSKVLKASHFILYRMISSQISYLILSLGYACVSAAFQIHFDVSFKGGFGVYWMMSYLTMSAVGGANENVATMCFATYPPIVGFWILSWVIINISPTFSPMALTSPFYRYGYLFPIHNSVEAFKVIFFDAYRGQLGRNIGILVAWIVVNNALMPFTMKFFAYRMRKKALAEASK